MTLQRNPHPFLTVSIAITFVLAIAFVWRQSSAQAHEEQEAGGNYAVPQEETNLVQIDGPNMTEVLPSFALSLTELPPEGAKIVRPTEAYLVRVDGPNLSNEIPPLDKSKAMPLPVGDDATAQSIMPQGFVPGQWYDHYAYYPLDGTEVEQYTNFKETTVGQHIELQGWRNDNGGSNRFVYDGWTGPTYNWLNTWLNNSPTLRASAEYTQGYGTRLQTYFKTNSSSCPCWLSDYRVGDH